MNNQPAGGLTAGGIPVGGMPVGGIPTGGILGGPRGILPAGSFPTDGIWNNILSRIYFACHYTTEIFNQSINQSSFRVA